jgi:hypothetical protein
MTCLVVILDISGIPDLLRLLSYWTYDDMPSSHLGHLRHLDYLSHLSHLSIIGNLNILNPYPLDTTLTDS